jgi:hypothetical protein
MACRIMDETIVLLVYASEKQFLRSDHELFPRRHSLSPGQLLSGRKWHAVEKTGGPADTRSQIVSTSATKLLKPPAC